MFLVEFKLPVEREALKSRCLFQNVFWFSFTYFRVTDTQKEFFGLKMKVYYCTL